MVRSKLLLNNQIWGRFLNHVAYKGLYISFGWSFDLGLHLFTFKLFSFFTYVCILNLLEVLYFSTLLNTFYIGMRSFAKNFSISSLMEFNLINYRFFSIRLWFHKCILFFGFFVHWVTNLIEIRCLFFNLNNVLKILFVGFQEFIKLLVNGLRGYKNIIGFIQKKPVCMLTLKYLKVFIEKCWELMKFRVVRD